MSEAKPEKSEAKPEKNSEADPDHLSELEFAELLDRWGADRANWPGTHARAVDRLLADSPAAVRELAAARALDGWLGGLREHRAPAGLATAIMDRVEPPDRLERLLRWLAGSLWRPVLIGALPVLAGFAIAFAVPADSDADFAGRIGTLAFVDLYTELNDADQP